MTDERTPAGPSRARTFGPALLAYPIATALTGAHFWGDSVDYAEGALDGNHFWDFGHLFWRPLGWLLGQALLPLTPSLGAADERAGMLMLLLAVCWLAGLGSLLFLRGLLAEAGIRPWPADLAALAFLVSQTFLNYAQTASSYVPGLCCLLLGCYLLARAARRPEGSGRTAVWAGLALACALGFWFPYVWALPAAGLLPPLLGGIDRARVRLTVVTTIACAAGVALTNAAALAAQGVWTAEGALAWVKASQHGITGIAGFPRMVFGLARSFVYLGEDGTLYRRYLGKDPINPVTLLDLVKASLWQIGLFYLFLGGLVLGLARSGRGRRLLVVLAVAAAPTLAFAVAWQGGDMERYLPLYPFLFLALAGLFGGERVPRWCQGLAVAFFAVAAAWNAPALARPVLERRHQELSARAGELVPHIRPGSRVFTVNDEVAFLRRNYPLNPLGHRLPMYGVVEPGKTALAPWRTWMRKRVLDTWERGGDVWVTRRVLSPTPRPEWLWVDDQATDLRWAHVHGFFNNLETVEAVGGEDGYVRLAPTEANRALLKAPRARFALGPPLTSSEAAVAAEGEASGIPPSGRPISPGPSRRPAAGRDERCAAGWPTRPS